MDIKKHKVGSHWIYGEYDFYIDGHLVAKLRRPQIGKSHACLYFLPDLYGDDDRTRIHFRYQHGKDPVEVAANMVRKKLYKKVSKALSEMKQTTIER